MEKYQMKGQGTLNSIVALVLFFLIIDVIIAIIIVFNIKLEDIFNTTDNTVVTPTVSINNEITDNTD